MKLKRIGVDLAKSVFEVHGVDLAGADRRSLERELNAGSMTAKLFLQPNLDQ
jgi:hypothetical protein